NDRQARLVQLLRVEGDLVGDADDAGLLALARVQAQVPVAAGDDEADVGVGEAVGLHGAIHGLGELLAAVWDLEADAPGGVPEALEVCLLLEDLAVVGADALEDAV